MTVNLIGAYAQVIEDEPPNPWHLIESQVADDVVTKCGRRLHMYAVEQIPPGEEPRCSDCHPEVVANDVPGPTDTTNPNTPTPADYGEPV